MTNMYHSLTSCSTIAPDCGIEGNEKKLKNNTLVIVLKHPVNEWSWIARLKNWKNI